MTEANRNGTAFEWLISQVFHLYRLGYASQWRPGWKGENGERIRVDYKIDGTKEYPAGLCVEAKYQQSPGSASEKIRSTIERIKFAYELPTILVIDGKEGLRVINQAKSRSGGQLVAVCTFMEFFVLCKSLSQHKGRVSIEKNFDPRQGKLF